MNILKIYSYILIIFLIFEFSYSDDDPKIKLYFGFNESYTNISHSEYLLFGNIKFLNENTIFYNIPRIDNSSNITFAKINLIDNNNIDIYPWPNDTINYFIEDNCSSFCSIIAFEFDNHNNIYLLDEGNEQCPIKLYKFDSKGNISEEYTIYNNSNRNINIIDFVLDITHDYIYISYYNNNAISSDNVDYEEGFIVKKLDKENKDDEANIVLLNDKNLKYDIKYTLNEFNEKNFTNITKKLISITLSCDGEFLFFSPILSRKIYSIKTNKLRKSKNINITLDDVNESYKNDASSAMVASNLGNLYLNGLENNVIYIAGQIDKDLSIFDYKGVDKRKMEDTDKTMNWTTKMSIYDGTLYIVCKDIIRDNNDTFNITTQVFNLSIYKEKSYVYKCAGIGQKWDWETYIVWILFIVIVIFVLVFVFIGNKEDKNINKKD